MLIINNVVPCKVMRKIQTETIEELAKCLKNSFGPKGSTTCIKKENALSKYTKDGHSIISSINYNGIIEQSIKDDIESITRYIVKTVGDGTTSAVLLSSYIFKLFVREEDKSNAKPADFIRAFQSVVNDVSVLIKNNRLNDEMTLDDVYDIAMIATDGDSYVSNLLKELYKAYGNGVFIDVFASTGEEFAIKNYNGMALSSGYDNVCYINNSEDNTCVIDNPSIYIFQDPVDTREMGAFFESILFNNIITPCNQNNVDALIPTVIFAPKISRDVCSALDVLNETMTRMSISNRPPICVISDYQDKNTLDDICAMTGARYIRKYIDPEAQKADIEKGLAPTPETVTAWAGTCERAVVYGERTTFINPSKMIKDGESTNEYSALLTYLKNELKNAEGEGDVTRAGNVRRRLQSLEGNLVELYVGGITQADRDSLRDLVEDAVLSIRSAAENGVGLGANMSAARAIQQYCDANKHDKDSQYMNIATILLNAYASLEYDLFDMLSYDEVDNMIESDANAKVYNIRTGKYDYNVKASIEADIVILQAVSKIIAIMASCNQFIVPSPAHNVYVKTENLK